MSGWTIDGPQRLTLADSVDRLDVSLLSGRLAVVGADGPARVEVTRAGRPGIVVEHRDGRLSVRQERPPNWRGILWWLATGGWWTRVHVSVAVPPETRADLRLVDGSAVVSGLRAVTRVDVTSGQVTLLGLAGRTSATLTSGPVEALGVTGDLTMETVSGELVLADGSAHRVHATTRSGSITCDLDNPRGSEIRLGTVSGSVTVRVRADSDLTVHLHSTSGNLTSAFAQVRTGDGPSWSRDGYGVLGGGDGQLWATSTSGSIALLSRPLEEDEDGPVEPDTEASAEPGGPRDVGAAS
ncbi:DUF4097 domain-containing protein [Plantactinospora sp. GCM10030261]|uniref:DUF4097 family beta strand repeat-containing protein n=1 Tax=Plantactinospora sp. GCM10030261 TaxID=3273420 RepID=UPI00361ADA91